MSLYEPQNPEPVDTSPAPATSPTDQPVFERTPADRIAELQRQLQAAQDQQRDEEEASRAAAQEQRASNPHLALADMAHAALNDILVHGANASARLQQFRNDVDAHFGSQAD